MGLFGFRNKHEYVDILGETHHISFLPTPDGERRIRPERTPYIVSVKDANGPDKIFYFTEGEGAMSMREEAERMIKLAKNHGIPVLGVQNGQIIIADALDTPDSVVESHNHSWNGTIQKGLDAYRDRLEARRNALKAAASMADIEPAPGDRAAGVEAKRESGEERKL